MIDDNKHYMNMSAVMLALRNEQSRQEKKKVRVKVHGSMRMGKDERKVQDYLRT